MEKQLIFIKFGGSLITNKDRARHAHTAIIRELLSALRESLLEMPDTRILVGHGSGSFGHKEAQKHGIRSGITATADWLGYHAIWHAAHDLHQIVLNIGLEEKLPFISFPPSAMITASNRQIATWNTEPIASALENGLIPLIYGDVVIDDRLGGTILSTETLFVELAASFKPNNVYLLGKTHGVYTKFPHSRSIIPHITSATDFSDSLQGSQSADVTGGMRSKVSLMQELCALSPQTEVRVLSGEEPQALSAILQGEPLGTLITHD